MLSIIEAVASITIVKCSYEHHIWQTIACCQKPNETVIPRDTNHLCRQFTYIFFKQGKPSKMYSVERLAVFYIHMLVCLQNLQATRQKVLPYRDGHRHTLHSCFALPFIKNLCHLILFCTSPMEGAWNSMHALKVPCFSVSCSVLYFICLVLKAKWYISFERDNQRQQWQLAFLDKLLQGH